MLVEFDNLSEKIYICNGEILKYHLAMFKKEIDRREFLRIMAAASLGIMSHNSIRAMESSFGSVATKSMSAPKPKVKERLIGFNL